MVAGGRFNDALVEVRQRRVVALGTRLAPHVLQRLVAVVKHPRIELADALRDSLRRNGVRFPAHGPSTERCVALVKTAGNVGSESARDPRLRCRKSLRILAF